MGEVTHMGGCGQLPAASDFQGPPQGGLERMLHQRGGGAPKMLVLGLRASHRESQICFWSSHCSWLRKANHHKEKKP